jgi:protein involved in polysaccharide export with SLBB domain
MFRKLTSVVAVVLMVTSGTAAPGFSQTRRDRSAVESSERRTVVEQQMDEEQERPERPVTWGLDEPVDPDTYVIGPYDEFVLVLHGQAQRRIDLQVLPEGVLVLPNLGAISAAGLTITEFRNKLKTSLKRYYKNIDFDFQLVAPRAFVVYVLGEVKNAGAVTLHAPFRVGAAIEAAGGTTERGSLRYIEIREGDETVGTVDLFSFLRLGRTEDNPILKEGQSVYIPARQATASISGEVWNTGSYEIRPGETVTDLIRFAGGPQSYAELDLIILERHETSGRVHLERFGIAQADTVELQDRDMVVVPDRRTLEGGSYVMLRGGGGREGKVYIEEGETIASFIPRIVRLRENHDISRAVIERENEDGSVEYIPVNMEKILAGDDEGNIPLKNGDAISIPEKDDYVYVTGEVVEPGEIEFQRGLPAERYIALAGGPTRAGSMNKLTIYSKDGTSRGGNRESMVYRGDTILVERRITSYVGPLFVGLTSLTSLILSVIAVSR